MKKAIANELHFDTDFVVVPETLLGEYVDLVAASIITASSLTFLLLYYQVTQRFMETKMEQALER